MPTLARSLIDYLSLKLTKEQITFALPTIDVRNTVLADQCPLEVDFPCQPRKYRAYNGYCNNVQNPRWGNANTRYLRFLPPDYSDGECPMSVATSLSSDWSSVFRFPGVSIPRQSSDGTFLPSARDISLAVHKDVDNPHLHLTAMAAIWGQLVHNDISHTPQMAGRCLFFVCSFPLSRCLRDARPRGLNLMFPTNDELSLN